MDEKLEKVDKLKEIAKSIGATLPQFAIAWVAKNDHVSVVLMGATKEAQASGQAFKACFFTGSCVKIVFIALQADDF